MKMHTKFKNAKKCQQIIITKFYYILPKKVRQNRKNPFI